jgi:hypothetical protein
MLAFAAMALRKEWVLQTAVVDVQYGRGVVFLDKCGSMTLLLEDALGKAFESTIPSMDHGELRSPAERLVVSYGLHAFNVTQSWQKAVARVEHVAGVAWEIVANALSVSQTVTRVGVRFIMQAGADTKEEAEKLYARCQLAKPPTAIASMLGDARVISAALVSENDGGRLRISMDVAENKMIAVLVEELSVLIAPHAFLLDLDFAPTLGSHVSKGDLRDFIRSSWQRTREIAKLVGAPLGMDDV